MKRKWIARVAVGLLLVLVCVRLGMWQLDRNEQRSARNAVIEANAGAEPAPLDELIQPGQRLDPADQWRSVEISGRFDADNELLLRLRPVDGQRGVHALTPLVTASGAAVVIDRGFLPGGDADGEVDVPDPPTGDVTVIARLRPSEAAGAGGEPTDGAVRRVDLDALGETLPYPLYGAWGELVSQQPAATGLQPVPPPESEAGPHLSYAIQWFLFAAVGVGGFIVLFRTERREQDDETPPDAPPSGGSGSSRRVDMGA